MSILDSFRVDGKVALVTGASSGLGVAFAEVLAGADVAICARRADLLEGTAKQVERHGRRALVLPTVTRVEECDRAVSETLAELGRLDILVNNAGVATAVPAVREQPDDFRRVVDINLLGAYWMAQACGRAMSGSSIVNIGSVLGLASAGLPQAAYAATKAAVMGLTRDLAQQWTGRQGIRVNTLAPGYFPSDMTRDLPDGYLDRIAERVPAGRLGDPRELALAVLYLASDASSYITGALLVVDGGMLTTAVA
jgi:NAD(P)-dependent dehydrogenase (short-subunit alcohol dehydrogenase family)